jgi:hypothetical protein
MTNLPDDLVAPLRAAGLSDAIAHLDTWLHELDLYLQPVSTNTLPTFQVLIRTGRRSHPLLTLYPPPNNPDVPFQKMKGLAGSPYANGGPRQAVVEQLNSQLPEQDIKPLSSRDRFYKIHWHHFADPVTFSRLRAILDRVISRVRE